VELFITKLKTYLKSRKVYEKFDLRHWQLLLFLLDTLENFSALFVQLSTKVEREFSLLFFLFYKYSLFLSLSLFMLHSCYRFFNKMASIRTAFCLLHLCNCIAGVAFTFVASFWHLKVCNGKNQTVWGTRERGKCKREREREELECVHSAKTVNKSKSKSK